MPATNQMLRRLNSHILDLLTNAYVLKLRAVFFVRRDLCRPHLATVWCAPHNHPTELRLLIRIPCVLIGITVLRVCDPLTLGFAISDFLFAMSTWQPLKRRRKIE